MSTSPQRITAMTEMILNQAAEKTGFKKTQIIEHLVLKYKREILKGDY